MTLANDAHEHDANQRTDPEESAAISGIGQIGKAKLGD
jgi:hypothetical protein